MRQRESQPIGPGLTNDVAPPENGPPLASMARVISSPPGEQVANDFLQLLCQVANLDQALSAFGGDLLDRLASTDRFHGDLDFARRAMGRRLLDGESPPQGRSPTSQVNDGICPEYPDQLRLSGLPCYLRLAFFAYVKGNPLWLTRRVVTQESVMRHYLL